MKMRTLLPTLLLALPLAACTDHGTDAAKSISDTGSSIGRSVQQATDKARKEMSTGNFKLSVDGLPTAEITPAGALLIEGKDVVTTPVQRAQLLEYRHQVEGIAMAGMDIGVAGANLGVKAAGEALKGVFSGQTEGIEQRVNAEADKLKVQAKGLCDKLPAMLATQQALAASLPAFAPYATMDQTDVDGCDE
ncbi:hypothetical protein [Stenotrophomonas sp. NPDC078853]|uniref:hypothetical protein n=1 Tax=Stenotrophomonas sp. NPDC078853 TaxID=3364534 RepID=UPI00384F48ED